MSNASQFLHVSLYGSQPRKGEQAWASITGIVQEGARAPGAARHVPYPAEPTVLYGITPIAAGTIALEHARQARDAKGRHLRRDGAVLLAAVLSYPVRRDLVEDRDAPDALDLYRAWRADAVDWCRDQYGEALLSVIEHADEDYPHLHAYAVPALGPDDRLMWEIIHPGRAALRQAEGETKSKAEQRAAYKGAMQVLQDEYHAAVSSRYGHARLGPKRQRLQRTEHLLLREAQRRQVAQALAYEEERAQLRHEVEAELAQAFDADLSEARRRAQALAEARDADQHLIAALLAECARLRDEVRSLSPELGPGYGR